MGLVREVRRVLPCAVLLWTALLCLLGSQRLMGRLDDGDVDSGVVGLVRTGRLWCCHGPFQCERAGFLTGVTGVGSLRPGDCECEEGYEGGTCSPRCDTNCSGHGRCDAPDTCACFRGWSGEQCDEAVCHKCFHGSCAAPDMCTCRTHYHGPACDVYCDRHGEYIGDHMAQGLKGLSRAESARVRQSKCRCHAGWTGEFCTEPVCDQVQCIHGTCVAPDECKCARPWVGPECSAQATRDGTLRFMTDDLAPQRERKWGEEVAELRSERAKLKRLVDSRAKAAKQALPVPPPPWKPSWTSGGKVQRRGGAAPLVTFERGRDRSLDVETHRSSAALEQLHRSVFDEFRVYGGVGGGVGNEEELWQE